MKISCEPRENREKRGPPRCLPPSDCRLTAAQFRGTSFKSPFRHARADHMKSQSREGRLIRPQMIENPKDVCHLDRLKAVQSHEDVIFLDPAAAGGLSGRTSMTAGPLHTWTWPAERRCGNLCQRVQGVPDSFGVSLSPPRSRPCGCTVPSSVRPRSSSPIAVSSRAGSRRRHRRQRERARPLADVRFWAFTAAPSTCRVHHGNRACIPLYRRAACRSLYPNVSRRNVSPSLGLHDRDLVAVQNLVSPTRGDATAPERRRGSLPA